MARQPAEWWGRVELEFKRHRLTENTRSVVVQGQVVWVASGSSVFSWDEQARAARKFGPSDGVPNAAAMVLYVDDEGMLWLLPNGFSHSVCPDCLVRLYPDYAAHRQQG